MIETILTASGVQHRATRYTKPPSGTYAVYFDDITTDGPDGMNMLYTHEYTIELYEYDQDSTSEAAIEAAINAQGLKWTKQPRYWIQTEQLYQVIYEFSYIEKRRTT